MSAQVAKRSDGALTKFQPEKARETQAIHDARIELAARIGNTEAMEQEIDRKLDHLEEGVQWWRAKVRPNSRPSKSNADSALLTVRQAQDILHFDQQTISRWAKKLARRDDYREEISRAARKKMQLEAAHNHRGQGTGEYEWWTPAEYVEAARATLGEIDLDPATTAKANETIKASRIFTKRDNGLTREWEGRVWLNPPYAQPLIGQFIDKLCGELAEGRVSAAVMLTHNYTDTEWFHTAEHSAALLCFTRGRIGFLSPTGERAAPTQGQAFFYYGGDEWAFRNHFSGFGFIR